jgi:RimJ/RimL family protein N-acetyltransferase
VDTTLVGQYVMLRPLGVVDAELTQKWRTGGRAKLLNRGAQTVEEQAAWIAARPESEMNFVQIVRATGQPVGMISLVDIDLVHRRAEPAHFLIGEEEAVKGKPIAAEATKLIYGLAFDTLGLHRVYGPIASENKRMLRWHLYLGMHEEGRLRDHYFLNGGWQDAIMIGMLEGEYRATALPKLNALIGGSK